MGWNLPIIGIGLECRPTIVASRSTEWDNSVHGERCWNADLSSRSTEIEWYGHWDRLECRPSVEEYRNLEYRSLGSCWNTDAGSRNPERELERSHWDLRNGVGILKVKGNDKGGKQRPTEVKSTGFET